MFIEPISQSAPSLINLISLPSSVIDIIDPSRAQSGVFISVSSSSISIRLCVFRPTAQFYLCPSFHCPNILESPKYIQLIVCLHNSCVIISISLNIFNYSLSESLSSCPSYLPVPLFPVSVQIECPTKLISLFFWILPRSPFYWIVPNLSCQELWKRTNLNTWLTDPIELVWSCSCVPIDPIDVCPRRPHPPYDWHPPHAPSLPNVYTTVLHSPSATTTTTCTQMFQFVLLSRLKCARGSLEGDG